MKGVPIGEVQDDPDRGKRMVLGGFNVQCAIMRKVVPYNINGKPIDTQAPFYHDFRGGSIDRKKIR